jgi:ABC-type uncharacterized transport system ATPase subunit
MAHASSVRRPTQKSTGQRTFESPPQLEEFYLIPIMFNHQIFLGLIRPFKILLLDEVTVSLDVVVRQDLLRYLRRESEQRGATILYATHIFDGLDDWPTHLHYLCNKGHTGWQVSIASNIQLFFVIKKLLYTVSNNAISLRLSRGKLEN